MKRRGRFLILAGVGLAVACLFPKSEETFEFDGVNLRLRHCLRARSWFLDFVLWEHCGAPQEHPTAARLRELQVLPPIREADSQWLLIKGFTPGVRGWIGPGRENVRALGATSFGTPITLPAVEDLSQNLWVQWATKDPAAAKQFWDEFQIIAVRTRKGGYYLRAAYDYLQEHELQVAGTELKAHCLRAIEE